jgi:hypothetical protein
MNNPTTKTATATATATIPRERGSVVRTWIGRDGFPRVKLWGIAKPFVVRKLLQNGDVNTKTRKNAKRGYLTKGCSLSPSIESGVIDLCVMASDGCAEVCLDRQGLASVFEMIRFARIAKTAVYAFHRDWFLNQLIRELDNAVILADKKGSDLAVRLNVFSDVPWERLGILGRFPTIKFYDYTKYPTRAGQIRPNYWVTFSRSETNHRETIATLRAGNNVAVVFADMSKPTGFVGNKAGEQKLPNTWEGFEVVNGDDTDLRFEDKRGCVVGLRLKAHNKIDRAKAIAGGFAVRTNEGAS